jgi:hypothetical protein
LRARLQKQTQAELGLRWQHAMGNEREEILDSAEVLIAKLIKLEETQKVISSHDEEPVFGMMAAISDDEVFNKVRGARCIPHLYRRRLLTMHNLELKTKACTPT